MHHIINLEALEKESSPGSMALMQEKDASDMVRAMDCLSTLLKLAYKRRTARDRGYLSHCCCSGAEAGSFAFSAL